MSLRNCINRLRREGVIDADRARQAEDLFAEIEAEALERMDPVAAAAFASRETLEVLTFQLGEKRRQLVLQAAVASRIEKDTGQYRNAKGEEDLGRASEALFDRDDFAPYSNIEARRKAILGRAHSRMVDVLATFRRDLIGRTRNKATLRNMVFEVFGRDTGDASARELGKAWSEAAEFMRLKFNAAGGRIPKRADWGLPQFHDRQKVAATSFEEWRSAIADDLDTGKMIDEATGKPISPARLELALRETYETIRQNGANKFTPSGQARGVKLANRRTDHRFLVFKDPDAWLRYQERFGKADPFSTMMQHLDGMARDISMMEILGPNPAATMRWLEGRILKDGASRAANAASDKPLSRARGSVKSINDMFAYLTGSSTSPVNGEVANFFFGLRNFLQSAQLGAAFLSALTDLNFGRLAAKQVGIPPQRVVGQLAKQFTPGVTAHQKAAVRSGLIADSWSQQALAQQRYVGEVSGPEFSKRVSDAILRVSLLSPWTQAGRHAFGMEFMGFVADNAGRSFKELPDLLKNTLRRYGLGEDAWNVIRNTDAYEFDGSTFIRAEDIAMRGDVAPSLADDIATRFLEMIQTETEFAVPSASLKGRTALIGTAPPGTFIGELLRSVAMYRSFAVTVAHTHIARGIGQARAGDKGAYLADLLISTTVMGSLSLQLKEIAKGRDPRNMASREFMGAALLQGGGLGIFGDFLFQDQNRFGGSLGETLAGPVVGFGGDLLGLTFGNIAQAARGEDPRLGRDLVNFMKRYTPGSSLWFARLGLERLVFDRLQELSDPEARASFRARERRLRRNSGQRFFFRPGRTTPDRLPDLTKAIEVN